MLADNIATLILALTHLSPLILFFAFLIGFLFKDEEVKKPIVTLCSVCAFLTGCFGALAFEPIEPGGWNWQFIFMPFIWCKWALIGFCGSWVLLSRSSAHSSEIATVRWMFGAMAIILTGLTIANHTYVAAVEKADREFWRKVFFKGIASLPIEEYRSHLSRTGRESVLGHLNYNKQVAPELLSILAKVLPGGAVGLADQTTITRSLIEQILVEAEEARKRFVPGSAPAGLPDLARNPSLPPDIMGTLASDPSAEVRVNLALNSAAPVSVLERLASDEAVSFTGLPVGVHARSTLAQHPEISAARLVELAHDSIPQVRVSAALNIRASLDLLTALKEDADEEVSQNAWCTIGRSPNTPAALLEELTKHPSRYVWAAVASNANAPTPLLEMLLDRDDYATRMGVIRNLASGDEKARFVLRKAIDRFDTFDLRGLSTVKGLPKWVYVELIHRDFYEARQNAFERLSNAHDVSEQELRDLLSKADQSTLRYLAQSGRCSPLALEILAENPDPGIRTDARKTLTNVREHGVHDE